jgi:hypothetical protein
MKPQTANARCWAERRVCPPKPLATAGSVTGFGRSHDNLGCGPVPIRSSRVAVRPKPTASRRSGASTAYEPPCEQESRFSFFPEHRPPSRMKPLHKIPHPQDHRVHKCRPVRPHRQLRECLRLPPRKHWSGARSSAWLPTIPGPPWTGLDFRFWNFLELCILDFELSNHSYKAARSHRAYFLRSWS